MKVEDIPIFPNIISPSSFIDENRLAAPVYLQILIDQVAGIEGLRSLRELEKENITVLLGGKMSILYCLRVGARWVVVKFRSRGGQAEAEALLAWRRVGASVVEVLAHGVLPQVEGAVKYLVMEAAVDLNNDIALTTQDYLIMHPEEARVVAGPLGAMLAGMHKAVVGTDFGEFADRGEKKEGERAPQEWSSYLVGYLDKHTDDLLRLGFSRSKIKGLSQRVAQMEFPRWGVMLHGDFSARNSVLVAQHPYQIKVIDPNPLIGHPSWDFAILANNVEFARRRLACQPERPELRVKLEVETATLEGILEGYQAAGGEHCSSEAIAAAQLMHCIYVLPQKVYTALGKEIADDLESQVVRSTLAEKVEMLTR